MDLKRLEALVALAREGTVSAAADALGCGQPTVSHHLRRLEEETGAVLVQRVGRGVRLTPDGARLAERGEEVIALLRRAELELDASTTLASGRVRLAAFPSACSTLVPRLVATLRRTVPGMTLDLVEAEPPEAVQLLRSGRVDVAMTFSHAGQPPDAGIFFEHLAWDALHLVQRADTAGVGATVGPSIPAQALRELGESRWIVGCERCRTGLLDLCAHVGVEPNVGFASDDIVAVQALVAAGFGVTLLPGLALAGHADPGIVAHPVVGARRELNVATHGELPRPPAVEEVVQTLMTLSRE